MGQIIIAGTTINDIASAWDAAGTVGPSVGIYYGHGSDFGPAPAVGPKQYQDMEFSFPGVDGVGIKRFGFRGRMITARLMFINSSPNFTVAAKSSFDELVVPLDSFTIQIQGESYPCCRLVQGSGTGSTWFYFQDRHCIMSDYQFRQVRLV